MKQMKIAFTLYSQMENGTDPYIERLNLYVDQVENENQTLDELVQERMKTDRETSENYTLIESIPIRLKDGTLANRTVSTYSLADIGQTKKMETIAIKDGKVYDMVYYAEPERYNNYLPTIEKMIDSIEFVEFVPYISPIPYGISTSYPSTWQLEERDENTFRVSSPFEDETDSFSENLAIFTYPNTENKTIDNIVQEVIDDDRENATSYQLIDSNITKLKDGTLANKTVFTYSPADLGQVKAMETIALKDGKVYDMVYYAKPERYNNYLPTIENIINSTEFVEFVPYENLTSYELKINYPSNWELEELDEYNFWISSPFEDETDSFTENLDIFSYFNTENETLDNIVRENINYNKVNSTNYNLIESTTTRLKDGIWPTG